MGDDPGRKFHARDGELDGNCRVDLVGFEGVEIYLRSHPRPSSAHPYGKIPELSSPIRLPSSIKSNSHSIFRYLPSRIPRVAYVY